MHGTKYHYNDTTNHRNQITWRAGREAQELEKRSFHWIITVAVEEGIIDSHLGRALHKLRKARNTVHLRTRTYKAFIGTSRAVFGVLGRTIDQTRTWKAANP